MSRGGRPCTKGLLETRRRLDLIRILSSAAHLQRRTETVNTDVLGGVGSNHLNLFYCHQKLKNVNSCFSTGGDVFYCVSPTNGHQVSKLCSDCLWQRRIYNYSVFYILACSYLTFICFSPTVPQFLPLFCVPTVMNVCMLHSVFK